MIKLVIIALDGVLTSTSIEHFQAWKNMVKREFNLTLGNEIEELTKGVSRMEALERVLKSIGRSNLSLEDKKNLARRKNNMYVELIERFTEEDLFDGVLETLNKLMRKGVKIALGSGSSNASSIVEYLEIYDLFDYIVDPTNLKGKPDPDIFNNAKDYFGFKSEECMGIDATQVGIDAINSAGMTSVGIVEEGELLNCDYTFNTLKDIDMKLFKK